ncbi:acyl-CoA thioesterase [Chitinophaga polysaccharea]|uniref:acyl-CoA thioesterase n=1 Tax=Chitinophaga TaxID=79328 RepID=UPI001455452F|nr:MULTISPECIES: thioesterase family protein [Chitinophaga]NLR57291.1 acyl-CoA thioesterase [Chitinophaga polysaccharea]NLU91591.1 acyl-CoA thioesterase [Chitinophaga sp. Ak27]
MFSSITTIRVRYGETDQMGYLYYGNYGLYYEVGRAEAIRELGFTYRELEEQGVIMPVAELNVKYLRPAFYDDLITVKTTLREMPKSSKIQFHSELYNERNELLNVGVTTLVFIDVKTKQKAGLPEELKKRLAPFFQETSH